VICLLLLFSYVTSESIYEVLDRDSRFVILKQQLALCPSVSGALTNTLKQFTVFAAVNSALEQNLELQNIENRLKYCVVDGLYDATSLEDSTLLPTLFYPSEITGPLNVRITKNNTGSFVQWSPLNESIEADNGRVYVLKALYHIPPPSASVLNDVEMFSIFKELIDRTNLFSIFTTPNTTIFGVPNEILSELNDTLAKITASELISVLHTHIVGGQISSFFSIGFRRVSLVEDDAPVRYDEDSRAKESTKQSIDLFFTNVSSLFSLHDYQPSLVFNLDETMLDNTKEKKLKVIVPRDVKQGITTYIPT